MVRLSGAQNKTRIGHFLLSLIEPPEKASFSERNDFPEHCLKIRTSPLSYAPEDSTVLEIADLL